MFQYPDFGFNDFLNLSERSKNPKDGLYQSVMLQKHQRVHNYMVECKQFKRQKLLESLEKVANDTCKESDGGSSR